MDMVKTALNLTYFEFHSTFRFIPLAVYYSFPVHLRIYQPLSLPATAKLQLHSAGTPDLYLPAGESIQGRARKSVEGEERVSCWVG